MKKHHYMRRKNLLAKSEYLNDPGSAPTGYYIPRTRSWEAFLIEPKLLWSQARKKHEEASSNVEKKFVIQERKLKRPRERTSWILYSTNSLLGGLVDRARAPLVTALESLKFAE
jgi:hypothetical protein